MLVRLWFARAAPAIIVTQFPPNNPSHTPHTCHPVTIPPLQAISMEVEGWYWWLQIVLDINSFIDGLNLRHIWHMGAFDDRAERNSWVHSVQCDNTHWSDGRWQGRVVYNVITHLVTRTICPPQLRPWLPHFSRSSDTQLFSIDRRFR